MFKPFANPLLLRSVERSVRFRTELAFGRFPTRSFGSSSVAYVYGGRHPEMATRIPSSDIPPARPARSLLSPARPSRRTSVPWRSTENTSWLPIIRSPTNIDTFKIGSNGALTYVTSTPCVQPGNQCLFAANLFFDHTGSDLYAMELDADNNNETASYAVDKSSGALNYLGNTITGAFPGDYTSTFFIGDNVYAYSADQSGCMYPNIYAFQRESSGLLNSIASQFNVADASSGSAHLLSGPHGGRPHQQPCDARAAR